MRTIRFTLCTFLMLLICACTNTVIKKPIEVSQPSWDGGDQNSGWISKDAAGYSIVTPHFVARYNAMIEKYGNEFVPPIHANDGVEFVLMLNAYRMDPQHVEYFWQMNQWRRQGK